MPFCCGKKKKKEDRAAAHPAPPSVVVAQPQPGAREQVARATSATTTAAPVPAPVPQPAVVPQPPPPEKSPGGDAEKVVRKKKKAPQEVKKPVVPVVERVEPAQLHRSRSTATQPTQRQGDEDGGTSVTDSNWTSCQAYPPEKPDVADAATLGTGLHSLSAAEAATSSSTTGRH